MRPSAELCCAEMAFVTESLFFIGQSLNRLYNSPPNPLPYHHPYLHLAPAPVSSSSSQRSWMRIRNPVQVQDREDDEDEEKATVREADLLRVVSYRRT